MSVRIRVIIGGLLGQDFAALAIDAHNAHTAGLKDFNSVNDAGIGAQAVDAHDLAAGVPTHQVGCLGWRDLGCGGGWIGIDGVIVYQAVSQAALWEAQIPTEQVGLCIYHWRRAGQECQQERKIMWLGDIKMQRLHTARSGTGIRKC